METNVRFLIYIGMSVFMSSNMVYSHYIGCKLIIHIILYKIEIDWIRVYAGSSAI